MAMPQDSDWSWLRAAIEAPDVTLEVYEAIPEELARRIEVADGMIVLCESPTDRHQAVQHALLNALSDAARKHDQRKGTCHRARADIDVLLTEVPFHFRRPDLAMFRCLDDDRRSRWRGRPIAADVLIVVEIPSPHSVSDDQLVKRVRYARAGIEHQRGTRTEASAVRHPSASVASTASPMVSMSAGAIAFSLIRPPDAAYWTSASTAGPSSRGRLV
jgi:Uma2 family endonuclease